MKRLPFSSIILNTCVLKVYHEDDDEKEEKNWNESKNESKNNDIFKDLEPTMIIDSTKINQNEFDKILANISLNNNSIIHVSGFIQMLDPRV